MSLRLVASTVRSSGTVNTGIVVSIMLTVNAVIEWFPDASVTIQLTIVSPTGKNSGASL